MSLCVEVVSPPPSEIADPFQEYKRATDEKISSLEKVVSESSRKTVDERKYLSNEMKLLTMMRKIISMLSEEQKTRVEMSSSIRYMMDKISSLEKILLYHKK
jgi:hypothetical protein